MAMLLERETRKDDGPLSSFLSDIKGTELLNLDEELTLAYRVQQGDCEARDSMVRANLRLVVHIARDFTGRGLPLSDLIQEGSMGLMHAVEAFDPDYGTRFSTYASFWVKQSIRQAIENRGMLVRVPSYAVDLVANWRRTIRRLQYELGRDPTTEEVAHSLKLSKRRLRVVEKALRIYNACTQSENDAERNVIGDTLPDSNALSPDEQAEQADELRQVLKLVDGLDEREATVLRLRFGLNGEEPMTLGEVGERVELTRERVRQIEQNALRHLRERL